MVTCTVSASNRAVCYTRWLSWFSNRTVDRNRRGRFPLSVTSNRFPQLALCDFVLTGRARNKFDEAAKPWFDK